MTRVLAFHTTISTNGFWLPNDPRGSWSDQVWVCAIKEFGGATKTSTIRSLGKARHDHAVRRAAKQSLKHPPVLLTGVQARAVGRGFAALVERSGLTIWACAILPGHAHLVIARHRFSIEQIGIQLKGGATKRLSEEGIHPMSRHRRKDGRIPKCWSRGSWDVYLDNDDAIRRAIRYVENNPVRDGKPRQRWTFVTAYNPS